MFDSEFIRIVKGDIRYKFPDITDQEVSIIIQVCNVLDFLEADSAFMEIYYKSKNVNELFRDSFRLTKIVLDDFDYKIKDIEKKDKKIEELRFLSMLNNVKEFLITYKDLL
jgi:hypothetical protein